MSLVKLTVTMTKGTRDVYINPAMVVSMMQSGPGIVRIVLLYDDSVAVLGELDDVVSQLREGMQ